MRLIIVWWACWFFPQQVPIKTAKKEFRYVWTSLLKSIHLLIYYAFIVFFPNRYYLSLIILGAGVTEINELKSVPQWSSQMSNEDGKTEAKISRSVFVTMKLWKGYGEIIKDSNYRNLEWKKWYMWRWQRPVQTMGMNIRMKWISKNI